MYKYEFGAIFACEGKSDEDIQVLIGKVREIINDCHGRIVKEDVWGKKELAYPVKKQNFGFYMFTTMMMEPAETKKLQEKLKLNDGVLRYLLLNLDKEPGYRQHQAHLESKEETAPKNELDEIAPIEEGIEDDDEDEVIVEKEVKAETKPKVKPVKKEVVAEEAETKTEVKVEKPKNKTTAKKTKPVVKEESKVEAKKEEPKEEPVKEEAKEEKKKESKPAKDLDQLLDEIL